MSPAKMVAILSSGDELRIHKDKPGQRWHVVYPIPRSKQHNGTLNSPTQSSVFLSHFGGAFRMCILFIEMKCCFLFAKM